MRHHTMPEREALSRIRPKNRSTRMQFLAISGGVLLAISFFAGLLYLKYRSQQYREQNWTTAIATVEDARTKLVAQVNSRYGGGMLYEVQVLAKYPVDGLPQERWITVEQTPKDLDYAQFQTRLWKGKQCFVRWKPSNPDQVVAEIN